MPSWIRAAAGFCLLLSGAAGLVYEVVWERYLRSLMGNTTGAVTAVLAAFMGGIALGGWLFAGAAQRSPRRLRLYAWLELGCTLHALAFPALLSAVGAFHAWAIAGAEETSLGLELARLALACGLLLPPAVLMGGTVPLLAGEVGATHLPALYAANSLGAVAGCLAAGFWLIEWLGLRASLNLAACLNVLAALIALMAARLGEGGALCRANGPEAGEVVAERPILAGAFLSGAASMTLEVGWTRLLAMLLGSSVHSFALMLACFISGITAGAWSIGPGVAGRVAAMGFVRGQVLAAFLALLALPLAHGLPTAFVHIKTSASWSFGAFQAVQFVLSGLMMLPAAFFFGRTFPLAARAIAPESGGAAVGRLYAANTAGTLAGAVLAGVVLVPGLGVRLTLILGALGCLAAAAFAALSAMTVRELALGMRAPAAALAVLFAVLPSWNPMILTQGAFRLRRAPVSEPSGEPSKPRRQVVFFREDATTTVSVEEFGTGARTLRVNGKADASTREEDMRTQLLLAHAPLVLHPHARDVLVIGLGSGTTMAAALAHPIRRADCVELSPAVREALPLFESINRGFWKSDGRARILVNDARTFLLGTPNRYDCIVSEPSNPWVAGVASLFSQEFFELCRDRLNPGGVMAQWLHTYEFDEQVFKILLQTFRSAFPHAVALRLETNDIQLLGSTRPIRPDFAAARARMGLPAVASDLRRAGVNDLFSLAALACFSETGLAEYSAGQAVHTDDFPIVDFLASRAFFASASVALPDARYRFGATDSLAAQLLGGKRPDARQLLAFARGNLRRYSREAVLDAALEAAAALPADVDAQRTAADALLEMDERIAALEHARAAAKLRAGPRELEMLYRCAMGVAPLRQPFFEPPDVSEAIAAKLQLRVLEPAQVPHRLDLVRAYLLGARWPEAERELQSLLVVEPSHPAALELLARLREQERRRVE
ncbi:MAG: fused MFS/spermidine synthase [Candidatus Wallbacteria bacterium]|nr:fused MFS/spermidine synthase [Candidatus Wallbacteria bacterium]